MRFPALDQLVPDADDRSRHLDIAHQRERRINRAEASLARDDPAAHDESAVVLLGSVPAEQIGGQPMRGGRRTAEQSRRGEYDRAGRTADDISRSWFDAHQPLTK